jgi:SAM-dependent methyltransferase
VGSMELEGSERGDEESTRLYQQSLLSSDPRNCLEEPLRGRVGLHVGCGAKTWSGWVNVDAHSSKADVIADVVNLPFDTESADIICGIHLLEHLYEWDAKKALREWLRVLKPGGKLILEVPCMDKIIEYIRSGRPLTEQMVWWAFWGNPKGRESMHHNYGYTISTLGKFLQKAGYVNIEHMEPRYHVSKRDMRFEAMKGAL